MFVKAAGLNTLFLPCFLVLLAHDSSSSDVQPLDIDGFSTFVKNNKLAVVLFKSSDECGDCNKAEEVLDKVPQPDLLQTEIVKAYLKDDRIASKFGATSYPAIVYFRDGYPALYPGQLLSGGDVGEFMEWLTEGADVATKILVDDSFEHLTQASTGATTGDWFVVFYQSGNEANEKILPAVESAAIRMKHRMNFATVDVGENSKLVERFKIQTQPEAILFRQGKMYRFEPNKFDTISMMAFVEMWYKNVKAVPVPGLKSSFDELTESIAQYIKTQVEDPSRKWLFLGTVAGICGLIVILVIVVFRKPTETRAKMD